jgi:glycerol-3-phosphate O-acyltransferase
MEQPVHHLADIDRVPVTAVFGRREQRVDEHLVRVRQITRITQFAAVLLDPVHSRSHRQLLR